MLITTAGFIWGYHGWGTAFATWIRVPLAHVIKRIFGLPDTLQPNTYTSIPMLGVFSIIVSTVGVACGVMVRKLMAGTTRSNS